MTTQDKDNNEAASALTLELRNIAEITRPSDQTLHLRFMSCRACSAFHHAINEAAFCAPSAIEAASASQSSTAGAAKRGETNDIITEAADVLAENNWRGDLVEALRDLAHVARQRQESPSAAAVDAALKDALIYGTGMYIAKPDGSAEHVSPEKFRAAVAEGVDTPELRKLLQEWGRVPFQWDALIAHLTTYGAQQREAGRQSQIARIRHLEHERDEARAALPHHVDELLFLAKQWENVASKLENKATANVMRNDALHLRAALQALASVPPAKAAQQPELTVWEGAMPESNGKSNFTAILTRKDAEGLDKFDGFTIARSEYPDRVRYEADCVRHLIGELAEKPWITDYDADKHSGYVPPAKAEGMSDEQAAFDKWMHDRLFANPPQPAGPFDAWCGRAILAQKAKGEQQ